MPAIFPRVSRRIVARDSQARPVSSTVRCPMIHALKTVDAHVAGAPLRLVVDGLPRPIGKTIAQKRDWMKRHADHLRRALVLEPRGHRDMCAAMLVDPVAPG